jgi:hypothetical protein
MGNRWRFRYHRGIVWSDGGTQGGRHRRPLVVPVQASEGARGGKTPWESGGATGRESSTERADPALPRKASSEIPGARTANRHR